MKELLALVVYTLITFKAVDSIVYEDIFRPLRDKLVKNKFLFDLVNCHNCLSVWMGFFIGGVILLTGNSTPVGMFYGGLNVFIEVFLNGLFTGGVLYFIFKIK